MRPRGPAVKLQSQPSTMESPGQLPDFMIIGAMKAGTTTLHAYLRRDDRIFMASPKEPQFFSRDHVYSRGIKWYKSLFSNASPEHVCGEASTCYSRWPAYPDAPARIAEHAPHVKFIYVMRHPVDRLYSHYAHTMQVRRSRDAAYRVVSVDEFIETDVDAVSASLYIRQIERYLEFFSRSRFLFLTFDELSADPSPVLQKVQRFLNLEPAVLENGKPLVTNRTGDLMARSRIKKIVRSVQAAPGVSLIATMVPRSWRSPARATAKNLAHSLLGARIARRFQNELSPLLPETRARLLKLFEAPTRELEVFLGHSPPSWSR